MDEMTWEFILRIFVAALLGGAIGLEREYRAKEAGFRTHFLVALGAALFMVVSAYGFDGAMYTPEHRWDVSRVAAQVVSGIGFIGAGTIIFQKNENAVRGLTTAAGLWVAAECRSRPDNCSRPLGGSSHRSGLWRRYVYPCGGCDIPRARRTGGFQLPPP